MSNISGANVELSNLGLPEWYRRRKDPQYYDDSIDDNSLLVHQPEVYAFADYLLRSDGRNILIDLGCGSGRKIKVGHSYRLIGIDYGVNLRAFKRRHKNAEIIEHDFESGLVEWPDNLEWNKCIVICADVIEHLVDPKSILMEISRLSSRGAVVLLSTPDRHRVYGGENYSPPANPSHAQEWTLYELQNLLLSHNIPVAFAGHTISDNFLRLKNTSIIVCDERVMFAHGMEDTSSLSRPLAIIAAFNDEDIISSVCQHYLDNDVDLHLMDNWSDDDTYLCMVDLKKSNPGRVKVERFPASGPQTEYKWTEILNRKAEIASHYIGKWIIHVDSDEMRLSPWVDCSLGEALNRVAHLGFNCVDHCVVNFLATSETFSRQNDLAEYFQYFQFGRHPAHFVQRRTWLQPETQIDLSTSGGHIAEYDGAKVFPYRFPLLHFPIRSQQHGNQKIYKDRRDRYSRSERAEKGWHNHYDSIPSDQKFTSLRELGLRYDKASFMSDYIVEVLSDAVNMRSSGYLSL